MSVKWFFQATFKYQKSLLENKRKINMQKMSSINQQFNDFKSNVLDLKTIPKKRGVDDSSGSLEDVKIAHKLTILDYFWVYKRL